VIEVVSGKKFEEAVRDLVLKPSGMNASGFLDGAGLDRSQQTMRVIHGQYGRGARRGMMLDKKIEPWAWGLRGAGGLVTSVDDLLAWDMAIRSNAVLDAAATKTWTTPVKSGFALGWQISSDEQGRVMHRHGGSTRGYRCELLRYPDQEVAIAVLSGDSGVLPSAVADGLAKVLFPVVPSQTSARVTVKELTLNEYRAAVLESGLRLEVEQRRPGAVLKLAQFEPVRGIAEFHLDAGAAQKLAQKIRAALASEGHKKAPEGGIKAGVYLYPFADAVKDGQLLVEPADWMVMPGYRGRGEDGRVLIDDRIVLVLTDPNTEGAWPVMMHVDDTEAQRVAGELEKAAE
jgi:hypothetical protein